MNVTQKNIGLFLVICSLVLLALLVVVKLRIDVQEKFLCQITHTQGFLAEKCPAHQSNLSWMILAAFGISLLALSSGIYLMTHSSFQEKKQHKSIDMSLWSEDEKKLYGIIKAEGSVYQSDLIQKTGYSKVKTTRILDKLETRQVIERRRRGMTNILVLK